MRRLLHSRRGKLSIQGIALDPAQPGNGLVGNSMGTDLHGAIAHREFQGRERSHGRFQRNHDADRTSVGRRPSREVDMTLNPWLRSVTLLVAPAILLVSGPPTLREAAHC